MLNVFRAFMKRHNEPISNLTEMMELHPLSLSMLIQENYLGIYQGDMLKKGNKRRLVFERDVSIRKGLSKKDESEYLDKIADAAEFISFVDPIAKTSWNASELSTTLSNWGVVKMLPTQEVEEIDVAPYNKSAYFGYKRKQEYRKKLISGFASIQERGVGFIDLATTISEMIQQYKKKKEVNQELIDYFKQYKLSYKDVRMFFFFFFTLFLPVKIQDIWKCAHISVETMPNPRGKLSLRKLL